MSKFTDSEEAIPQELLLFSAKPTQVMIKDVHEVKYLPINSFENSDTVNFEIPAQRNLMIKNVEIVTQFQIRKGDGSALKDDPVSLVANPANALWKQVDIVVNNKYQLSNPMQQSSTYETFFSTILNVDQERQEVIFSNQGFLLDEGSTKEKADEPTNASAVRRSELIQNSKTVTMISDLNCNLLKTSNLLVTGLEFNVSLTKNKTDFLLLGGKEDGYSILVKKIYLKVTYVQPEEYYLGILEEELLKTPAIYDGHRAEISFFGITTGVSDYQFNNIFRGALPNFMVLCVQDRGAISGDLDKNPFTFYPFKSIQVYMNNREYFPEPLASSEEDNTLMMNHFYKALGYDIKGTCLINRDNFRAHFMIPIALARDRTVKFHHNLQEVVDFKVDIVFEGLSKDNLVLMVYSVYDQLIKIDHERKIHIV